MKSVYKAQFDFGDNWDRFLSKVDEERIAMAVRSLQAMLGIRELGGKRFLDAGCGSGLFSLAAKRLGARVFSFDLNPKCVDCAERLKRQYFPDHPDWRIERASVLDRAFLDSLEQADIVYSWGVLHHTGDMKAAIDLLLRKVAPGGFFFISIYNDQGASSRRWLRVKKLTNQLPGALRVVFIAGIALIFEMKAALGRLLRGGNPWPFSHWKKNQKERGMSVWHDWVDWCGGYPFEPAKPDDVINHIQPQGFVLEKLKTCGTGWGCNEFVFRKMATHSKDLKTCAE